MRKIMGFVAAGFAALASSAAAAQTNGWYMGAELGANWLTDSDFAGGGASVGAGYDLGYGILGQVGYGFGQVRIEGELGWRRNTVDDVAGAGGDGALEALSYMANVYYDIPTGTAFTPYLGAGLGGATLWAEDFTSAGIRRLDGDDTVLAYQGIAGVAYRLNDNLSIKADYRYFATEEAQFTTPGGVGVEDELANHSVMVGFTWRFGVAEKQPEPVRAEVPPPPPPPPPVETPERQAMPSNYMVFFDWDRADITPEAERIVRQAAANLQKGGAVRIQLTGHADRSGPEPYNMRLSQRRADNVKALLTRLGVPADGIGVVAKGETSPLVPTPDGVREPQNRRVEIVIP